MYPTIQPSSKPKECAKPTKPEKPPAVSGSPPSVSPPPPLPLFPTKSSRPPSKPKSAHLCSPMNSTMPPTFATKPKSENSSKSNSPKKPASTPSSFIPPHPPYSNPSPTRVFPTRWRFPHSPKATAHTARTDTADGFPKCHSATPSSSSRFQSPENPRHKRSKFPPLQQQRRRGSLFFYLPVVSVVPVPMGYKFCWMTST